MKTQPRRPMAHAACSFIAAFILAGGVLHAQHFEFKEHHLGPTGLYGVTSPKDIKITKVEKGSPADGKIKVGDIVTGAGSNTFKDQTRKQLADAIDQAETEASKGVLKLTLKDGNAVDLQLPVLGSYSPTAPHNCPKTDAIITRTADYLVKSRNFGRNGFYIGLLGLLATGEKQYIDVVRKEIHAADWAKPDIVLSLGKYQRSAWNWGYTNLLLAEYYLLTKDEYVRTALEAYSVALATGRDAAGLWGHGIASYDLNNGMKHGRLPGYAVMNQSSLPCFLSLILADKAGIKHPEVQAAIEQTHGFYTDFIGRGTLPYGVHDPNAKSYNNNGMSGLAAVAFALHGNKEGARFFSRMAAAAHNTLETGHTGHFFNQMWTGLGANLSGPEVTSAFFRETRWLHTLNRKWDGNFTYDCSGDSQGIFTYRGLSDAGSHLLNYCLDRRALFITGRDADPSLWLKGKAVDDVIGLASLDLKKKTNEELLDFFDHPMPKVRNEALWTLRAREHGLDQAIIAKVREGSRLERLSAISYFGYQCPPERAKLATENLAAVLRDKNENPELRAAAADSLAWLGKDAHPFFNDMLRLVAEDKPSDPRGIVDKNVGRALTTLCPDPYSAGFVTDKELFYQAARKLLDHRRADGRSSGAKLVARIPIEDFHHVGDRLQHIIKDQDRTYHSYHNLGPQTGALGIFANLKIDGGVEATMKILDSDLGKMGFKVRMLMEVLPKYGAAAKPALPRLREMNQSGRFAKSWADMIRSIDEAQSSPAIPFDEAMNPGPRKIPEKSGE